MLITLAYSKDQESKEKKNLNKFYAQKNVKQSKKITNHFFKFHMAMEYKSLRNWPAIRPLGNKSRGLMTVGFRREKWKFDVLDNLNTIFFFNFFYE